MNVKEIDFPEQFSPIIRRLQAAAAEKEMQDIMIVEDDFLSEINWNHISSIFMMIASYMPFMIF